MWIELEIYWQPDNRLLQGRGWRNGKKKKIKEIIKINVPGLINDRILQNERLLGKQRKKSTHIIIKLKNKADSWPGSLVC